MNVQSSDSPLRETTLPAKKNYLWPLMLAGLITTHILAVFCMVFVAVQDRSFAVEPDYYRKALHWDQIKAQKDTSERLGWKVVINVDDKHKVNCTAVDKLGDPIDGAIVELMAFSHVRASETTSLVLEPHGNGRYSGNIPGKQTGLWEFRLVISRNHDVFTHVEQQRL